MSAAQSETFSPQQIGLLCGLLLFAVILGEVIFPTHGSKDAMAEPVETMEDIAMRIAPVVMLEEMRNSPMAKTADGSAVSKSPDQMYQSACLACHTTGAAGAPKLGDAAAWKARMANGLESLVSSAINGVGAMPPRGGSQFDDDQIRAIVEYILSESE